jgi:hypothetical protein
MSVAAAPLVTWINAEAFATGTDTLVAAVAGSRAERNVTAAALAPTSAAPPASVIERRRHVAF